jgi:hypothetical protein
VSEQLSPQEVAAAALLMSRAAEDLKRLRRTLATVRELIDGGIDDDIQHACRLIDAVLS